MTTVDILRTLVAFDTTSHRSNLELIHWVADYLAAHRAKVQLVHSEDKRKANLLATIGPDTAGGMVLSGHSDVVPVTDQNWSANPFTLVERDGRFHGRGAADMKGFIAACLSAVPSWQQRALSRPIHLAFSYDEEIGCLGVPRLVNRLKTQVEAPALAIIGEPTEMRIGVRHRGFFGHRALFSGLPAHSSDPSLGASAIEPAAYLVTCLAGLRRSLASRGGGATLNIGRIDGGTAINIVPGCCEVLWEFRPQDETAAELVRDAVRGALADLPTGVTVEAFQVAGVPALSSRNNDMAVSVARELGALWPEADLPFGTEAGFFQQVGIPTVVCGPGSIAQAHQPDEWICATQLQAADRFMQSAGAWAMAPTTAFAPTTSKEKTRCPT
ncbi:MULTISPECIES: acetylornithine deacetylase [Variovorax]|jgi:acetylornithine deacetylase|uniref:acetylornithine deacetylase n=1 Tax=Variovorax TaxID=34072 RepID=UPI00086D5ADE|nr:MULTISPECIES: acetylornithine deacetylase [Variovorax]MBN8752340.1 acetylornithine deacetylase [Variovorax sp.]ODU18183.1 MAG: acetylornithine deacetylase (ArgE) [Variovorax sp. SCN 67-85]ODV26782.1 MAG: acetylornithine deacetylase (ArgE) [Variovorax sp. SCN 67-20]OJZ08872.1 MAG: acetylornithine deacetylase (ArgE) [Variovorax sp. 67-131]UKI11334.1 acetylornithine deacetylase [Variovorax paradoxus]